MVSEGRTTNEATRRAAVTKAVVLVAGFGTRLLPAAKAQPKEMLPVGRKPCVQYVVEEMKAAGIREVLFVTGRKKTSIEDFFDSDPELERRLSESGSYDLLEEVTWGDDDEIRFYFTRQSSQRGTADAVRLAEQWVGDEPFAVAFGDTIVQSGERRNLLSRLIATHLASGAACTFAVEEVPRDEVYKYGVVEPASSSDDPSAAEFPIASLVEKPDQRNAPSNLAIVPRYVFQPSIFESIRLTLPGKSGEIWLTDSIGILLVKGQSVRCVRLAQGEKRYDIGNFETYFKAFIDLALADERYGYLVRQHLEQRILEL
jgi:UTP--glucose-1-phosphate uridylyltransferase